MATEIAFGITLADIKEFLGYDEDDETYDAAILVYMDAGLAMLRELTGRQLTRAWYRDTLAAMPDRLYLREYPVGSIISVQLGGVDVATSDYQAFMNSGYIQFKNFYFPRFSMQIPGRFMTVDYVGGYETLPGNYLLALYSGIQAAVTQRNQISNYGGAVKRISVYDVGVTDFAVSKSGTSNAVLRETMTEQLGALLASAVSLGAPLLHESELIGDVPGSPT